MSQRQDHRQRRRGARRPGAAVVRDGAGADARRDRVRRRVRAEVAAPARDLLGSRAGTACGRNPPAVSAKTHQVRAPPSRLTGTLKIVSSGRPASGTRRRVQASRSTSSRQARPAAMKIGCTPGTLVRHRRGVRRAPWSRRAEKASSRRPQARPTGSGEPHSRVLATTPEMSTCAATSAGAGTRHQRARAPTPATTAPSSSSGHEEPARRRRELPPRAHRQPGGRRGDHRHLEPGREAAPGGHRADSCTGVVGSPPTAVVCLPLRPSPCQTVSRRSRGPSDTVRQPCWARTDADSPPARGAGQPLVDVQGDRQRGARPGGASGAAAAGPRPRRCRRRRR